MITLQNDLGEDQRLAPKLRGRSANGVSPLIMSYPIFASAAPLSRTSFSAKFSAEWTIATRVPEHWPRPIFNRHLVLAR